jgi:hypothetical protein
MAGDAVIEESAMLRHKVTGEQREVDVMISSEVAGHDVVVAVEATSTARPADAGWVERMLGKHRDLPTDKLVLVSEAGFKRQAKEIADDAGAVALAPVDLSEGDPVSKIVNKLKSIWPKTVALTPQRAQVWVRRPAGDVVWFKAPADLDILGEDGKSVGTLVECVVANMNARFDKIIEDIDLRNIEDDRDQFFSLDFSPWRVIEAGREISLCARYEGTLGPELHPIERVRVIGRAVIHVAEVELAHRRLGEIRYSYGESQLGHTPALLVVSESGGGEQMTIRLRHSARRGRMTTTFQTEMSGGLGGAPEAASAKTCSPCSISGRSGSALELLATVNHHDRRNGLYFT